MGVLFISLAKLYDMVTGINAEIIGTSQYYRIDILIFFVLNVIGIALNFFLIPLYGLNGAAYAVFASVFLYNTMRFFFIAIVMKIQPFTRKTFYTGLCAVCTYSIVLIIPSIKVTMIDVIIRTLLIGAIFGGMILTFHISEDISKSFHKAFIRLRIRE